MTDPLAHVQASPGDERLFPIRPDYGDQGAQRNVPLWANYFRMALQNPDLVFYFYDMTFEAFPPKGSPTPEKEMTVPKGKKLMQIVRCALRLSTFDDIKSDIATDFGKTLVSCKKLEDDQLQTGQFKFWAENEIENGVPKARKKATRFRMTLRQIDDIRVSKLLDYLASNIKIEGAHESILPIVQALDIVLGHSGKFSLETATPKQGKCFPLNPTKDIIEKFQLDSPRKTSGYLQGVRGYFASVRATTNSTLVNCNACCGAFYKAGPLVNLFGMFTRNQNPCQEEMKRIEKAIQGLRVELTHIQDERPLRTIFGLARPYNGPRNISFFHEKDEKTYTVADYWTKKGYERIQSFNYPVVNVGDKDHPTLVPPHVCNIIPGQMAKRKLDPLQTDDMIKHAIRTPEATRNSINTDAFRVLGLKDSSTLESFGISLSSDMVTLQGRVLKQPAVIYKTNSRPVQIDGRARWNLKDGSQVFKPGHLKNWGVLRITRDERASTFEKEKKQFGESFPEFFGALRRTLGAQQVDDPIQLGPHFFGTWDSGDEDRFKEMFDLCKKKKVGFLVIVLPDNDASTYKQIKRFGDVVCGIPTVCVLGEGKKFYKTPVKSAGQYFTNVALKINLKLNGINHTLRDQPKLYESTMVIGIDVTHPSPGPTKRTAPSVAAMVANIDKELAQWPVDLRINTAGKEMVDLLGPMLRTRLELWQSIHNALPDNLLIYRDGVSESQYKAVLEEELVALTSSCELLYGSRGLPRITLIIVGKRHHTRFFKKGGPEGCTNPEFGTVVDTQVTEARNWDFFLQSHHALQGTARPAHYFVLRNDIFTQDFVGPQCKISDYLQKLTYDMCYLFGRSTGPVSIPPPVYYADLACERSRCYGDFDDDISETSSVVGDERGSGTGKQVSQKSAPSKQGPSMQGTPGPSKSTPSKQGSGSTTSGKKEDSSKKQLQPTQGKSPDVMAGLSKKEKARLFEERIAANQKAAPAGSSKAEVKKPEAKREAKREAKPEGKAGEKTPEGKGKEKAAEGDKPKETAGSSKAEGKKPDTKGQGQKSGTQAGEKTPKEKLKVEIHPALVDTMFYI